MNVSDIDFYKAAMVVFLKRSKTISKGRFLKTQGVSSTLTSSYLWPLHLVVLSPPFQNKRRSIEFHTALLQWLFFAVKRKKQEIHIDEKKLSLRHWTVLQFSKSSFCLCHIGFSIQEFLFHSKHPKKGKAVQAKKGMLFMNSLSLLNNDYKKINSQNV